MNDWAKPAIEALKRGQIAVIHPVGNSMKGRVESGQAVTIDPAREPGEGDVVLVKVKGRVFLHLVKKVLSGPLFQIGNNKGGVNGWVGRDAIYGVMVEWDAGGGA
jgi:hypothetical protein